jgi:sugar phosphate isomerase/epimerase
VAEPADEWSKRDPDTGEAPGRARSGRAAKATGVAAKRAAAVRQTVARQTVAKKSPASKGSVPKGSASRKAASKKSVPKPPQPEARAVADRGRTLIRPPKPAPPGPGAVYVPDAKVALSTASVYPENTAAAFEIAGRLGYDGVEVMVWTDPVSQDVDALRRLSDYHGVPILAVHAPCLLITQRVWGTDPWTKLLRARAAAEKLGASAVVVHPPFRWQRQYARDFVEGVWRMAGETDVRFAVENMYPWRYRDREVAAYAPDWDPTTEDYRHFTVDLSHVATSRADALAMVDRMGDRLAHVHLADGSGSAKDEHLIPGRGTQPCAELLERLARSGFDGHVVLEVNTRRSPGPVEREAELAEALAFTRLHLATAVRIGSTLH